MRAVVSLEVSKLLNRGIRDWWEENGLDVDKDILEVQSNKPAPEVFISSRLSAAQSILKWQSERLQQGGRLQDSGSGAL